MTRNGHDECVNLYDSIDLSCHGREIRIRPSFSAWCGGFLSQCLTLDGMTQAIFVLWFKLVLHSFFGFLRLILST